MTSKLRAAVVLATAATDAVYVLFTASVVARRRVAAVGFHDGLEVVVQRKVLAHVRRQHLPRQG